MSEVVHADNAKLHGRRLLSQHADGTQWLRADCHLGESNCSEAVQV